MQPSHWFITYKRSHEKLFYKSIFFDWCFILKKQWTLDTGNGADMVLTLAHTYSKSCLNVKEAKQRDLSNEMVLDVEAENPINVFASFFLNGKKNSKILIFAYL